VIQRSSIGNIRSQLIRSHISERRGRGIWDLTVAELSARLSTHCCRPLSSFLANIIGAATDDDDRLMKTFARFVLMYP